MTTPNPVTDVAPRPSVVTRIVAAIRSTLLWLGSVLGVVCIVLFLAALLFGVRSQIVISGSMEPRMPVGSLVLVTEAPSSEVAVGDVVTVPRADGDGLVTHRVQEISTDDNGVVSLTLKGDANLSADPQPYPVATVGKVFLTVPGLGYVAAFLQGPAGIAVIGLVLVLILLAFFLPAPGTRRTRTASEASASAELDVDSVQRTGGVETTTELSGDSAVATASTRRRGTGGHQGSTPGAAVDSTPVVAPESGDSESHGRHTVAADRDTATAELAGTPRTRAEARALAAARDGVQD